MFLLLQNLSLFICFYGLFTVYFFSSPFYHSFNLPLICPSLGLFFECMSVSLPTISYIKQVLLDPFCFYVCPPLPLVLPI